MGLKLAHLILAHANPKQLQRLVERLRHEQADIYIHLDAKSDITKFSALSQLPQVYFVKKRVSVNWGTYSIIRATLCGMQEILDAQTEYSHINLLSGQDYPIKSADDAYRFFSKHQGQSFIECPVIDKSWISGFRRLKYYDFGDYNFPGHYKLQALFKFFHIKKRIPSHLVAMGRSQWFSITTESAAYVIKYLQDNPKVRRFFRMSFASDEILFQTILGNSPLKDTLISNNLRFIIFPDDVNHPATLTINDALPMVNSGKLYARKFNEQIDSQILDYLDRIAEAGANTELQSDNLLQQS